MQKEITIRQITEADYASVYNLIQTAFETAEHRDGDEQDFAVNLRKGKNHIPELEFVAEKNGQLIGHILLTKTVVTQPEGTQFTTLLVAPLSVLFEYRGTGVGSALMEEGLRIAQTMGYTTAFLVGEPSYYQRFGYNSSDQYGIRHKTLPAEYVLAKELVPGALKTVTGWIKME